MTDRKRGEETLHAMEEGYRLLFEKNPSQMSVYDSETLAFLAVNEAAWNHYGYSRDEFLSMTIRDIRPREDVPALLQGISKQTTAQRTSSIARHQKKNGELIRAEITSDPLVFQGRDARLVLATDVTARLRAEEDIRKSEERFRRLFDSNTIGIVIADLAGRILEAAGAEEAIDTAQRYEQPIHLLLTDVVMPSMSGSHMASESRLCGRASRSSSCRAMRTRRPSGTNISSGASLPAETLYAGGAHA